MGLAKSELGSMSKQTSFVYGPNFQRWFCTRLKSPTVHWPSAIKLISRAGHPLADSYKK